MDKLDGMGTPDEAGFTIDDLHAIPEGRLRYELIEGSLQRLRPELRLTHLAPGRLSISRSERRDCGPAIPSL